MRNRCWLRIILNDLKSALPDCDTALNYSPSDSGALSTRGFAYLRLNRAGEAILAYDAALQSDPKNARALYGRGIAKRVVGDSSTEADLAAAKALEPNVADDLAKYGFK